MREYVERMRTFGFRYAHENRFLDFDPFLQQRDGAAHEPLPRLTPELGYWKPSTFGHGTCT